MRQIIATVFASQKLAETATCVDFIRMTTSFVKDARPHQAELLCVGGMHVLREKFENLTQYKALGKCDGAHFAPSLGTDYVRIDHMDKAWSVLPKVVCEFVSCP